ncbi:transglutaminase-like domain-containing protein [Tautonia plasticadhaerens]|uniref:Transglutaminase-like superfamily protein n=1 Tax=Tautonia plasticadhaerens TaxID=2527974 RepID=A0A518GVP2_9BACT|nr:transglutaminase family protein [Tautonia plasticadhaerens]QDV32666.1 Transglutaminase-like superfamily protein [Tautonia plasticadhaerens]
MLIRAGYEMVFDVPSPTPMLLMLALRPEREGSVRRPGGMRLEPEVPVDRFLDGFGNRCARIVAPGGRLTIWDDLVVEDSGAPDEQAPGAEQIPVQDLPVGVLTYLLGSRYCEVERLSDIAWSLFGQSPTGWGRVQAVCSWVNRHVEFGYHHARPTKTAWDVYTEGNGVCRDFTQLAITFCRCLNIPARYATGYLGDIGVPPAPHPMDFSGWFEAYLGGRWYTFDARHNMPRIGRILMGHGRDAVDVALTTSFGTAVLSGFTVWTDTVGPEALAAPMGKPEQPGQSAGGEARHLSGGGGR